MDESSSSQLPQSLSWSHSQESGIQWLACTHSNFPGGQLSSSSPPDPDPMMSFIIDDYIEQLIN